MSVPVQLRVVSEEPSICKQLQGGPLGDLFANFRKVQSALPAEDCLDLPKVVVVGGTNAGKSSLLENITKCPVFPRNTSLCTKVPVRLHIRQADSDTPRTFKVSYGGCDEHPDIEGVLEVVSRFMKKADLEGQQYAIGKEISVEVTQPGVPSLELIDLPGIRNAGEAHSQTLQLVNSYLQDEDVVVLCVLGADEELDDSAALEAVCSAGKLRQTILVLTQADTCSNLNECLFDKILRTAPAVIDLHELQGVVAVINRKHTDEDSLAEAAVKEREKFAAILQAAAGKYAADNVKQALQEGVTVDRLLEQIASLFKAYLQRVTCPRLLASIHLQQCAAGKMLAAMGPTPSNTMIAGIMQELHDNIDFANLCTQVDQSVAQCLDSLPVYQVSHPTGLSEWAAYVINTETQLVLSVDKAFDEGTLVRIVTLAILQALDVADQLGQFESLREHLATTQVVHKVQKVISESRRAVDMIRSAAVREMYSKSATSNDFEVLKSSVRNYLIRSVIATFQLQAMEVGPSFQLEEKPSAARTREHLRGKLESLSIASKCFAQFTVPAVFAADGVPDELPVSTHALAAS